MSRRRWRQAVSRRSFLKASGGAMLALPAMASFPGLAKAQTFGEFPKRLVVFFSPNGTIRDAWKPTGAEDDFVLGEILSPLIEFQDKLIIVDGLRSAAAYSSPGDGHQTGMGTMLTGVPLLDGDLFEGGGGGYVGWGGGISVDQAVANEVGNDTALRSLELGVQVHNATVWSRMCYLGPNQPLPPENDPAAVFDRVFADLSVNTESLERMRDRRRSVLDLVLGEYNRLKPRLDAFDRQRLEAHITALREVETRLDMPQVQVGGSCQQPVLGELPPFMEPTHFEAVGHAQIDQLVMSLACDMTRVASLQYAESVSGHVFTNLGMTRGHHDMSHDPDDDVESKANLTAINTWYAEQFRYLLERMAAVPEGDGTLLDNSVVVWCNELGKGNSHTRDRLPFVLAGSCGGFFDTGRYVKLSSLIAVSNNRLLTTLMHAMDIPVPWFGDARFGEGPLEQVIGVG